METKKIFTFVDVDCPEKQQQNWIFILHCIAEILHWMTKNYYY